MTLRLASFALAVLSVSLVHFQPTLAANGTDASQLLLESNARWSENVTKANPDFFVNSAKGQEPKARIRAKLDFFSFLIWGYAGPVDRVLRFACSRIGHH